MVLNSRLKKIAILSLAIICYSCSVSYGFRGGSIDYTKIKTIRIPAVQNKASLVYPPLAANFSQKLQDFYEQRTSLSQVNRNSDLELVCEIVGYDLSPMSIGQDNFADRTLFVLQVKVHYVNNVNKKESFDKTFKAQRDFARNQQFNSIQDGLLEDMTDEIIKKIYNATIENW